jgi:glycine dehydrogenase subunit 2
VKTDREGNVDLNDLDSKLDSEVVGLMLTNPSTLGLFERNITEISARVHAAGGLMYGDGANLNAILGVLRPADVGFDCLHINVHKTFSTPHGAGGPGAGPVVVTKELEPYLPSPVAIRKEDGTYHLDYNRPYSIGRLKGFNGHFGILARAYTYLRMQGPDGLRNIAETAVLNANYLAALLKDVYDPAFGRKGLHEFVLDGSRRRAKGVRTTDVAKRLIDYGFHPPMVYFPLVVEEAIMIEPTETESRQTLDKFAEAMRKIAEEADTQPELLFAAPHNQPVGRLDEVTAARKPILHW